MKIPCTHGPKNRITNAKGEERCRVCGSSTPPEAMAPGEQPKKKARARGKRPTDDPNDPNDRYYMEPELIWWYSQNLPNRFRGCRTWRQLCEAACDGRTVQCLADGCERT